MWHSLPADARFSRMLIHLHIDGINKVALVIGHGNGTMHRGELSRRLGQIRVEYGYVWTWKF